MFKFLELVVNDVMTADPLTIEPKAPLAKLRSLFDTFEYSGLPVVVEGELVGWVTQLDLLKALLPTPGGSIPDYDEILARPVWSVMNPYPEVVAPEDPLQRVLARMIDTRYRSFPVVASDRLVGVIAREDILKGLRVELRGLKGAGSPGATVGPS
jgi:CBS domain-containing protein